MPAIADHPGGKGTGDFELIGAARRRLPVVEDSTAHRFRRRDHSSPDRL
jgi:hypothetical protein